MTRILMAIAVSLIFNANPCHAEEEWKWSDERASILHYFMNASKEYPIQLMRKSNARWNDVKVRIGGEEDLLLEFQTHREGAFVFSGSIVIYAHFSMVANGCELRAYDLTKEEEIWRTRLEGIGEVPHSKYRNRINLEVWNEKVITYGNESGGKYIEVRHVKTGRLISSSRVRVSE